MPDTPATERPPLAAHKTAKRALALGLGVLLALLPLLGAARLFSTGACSAPVFLARGRGILGDPTPPLAAVIQRAGGLPAAGAEMNADDLAFSASSKIVGVASWRPTALSVVDSNPLHLRLQDDDPTYGITLDVEVHYTDGSTRVLRWTTWRYGLVLCPFVIPYGDGPPWNIAPLD